MKRLQPDKRLQLYLAESGFPSYDIPKILTYCPQLIHSFTLEELAAVGLSDIKMFTPSKQTLYLRKFAYEIARKEAGRNGISDFIEEAIAIYAADTVEKTLTDKLNVMRDKLRRGE